MPVSAKSVASEGNQEVDVGNLDIDTETLKLILSYCHHHGYVSPPALPAPLGKPSLKDICEPWDKDFAEELNDDLLLKVCLGAKALGVASLVQLLAASIAQVFRLKDEDAVGELVQEELHVEEASEEFLKGLFWWARESIGVRTAEEGEARPS